MEGPVLTVAASSPVHGLATVFGAVLTGIGLVFLLVGLLIRGAGRARGGGRRTEGTIVGFDATDPTTTRLGGRVRVGAWSAFGGQTIYRPTVEFTTADGQTITATSSVGTNPRPGKVGDTVAVLYDPRNPHRVRVESRTGGCLQTAFIVLGGGIGALGLVALIASR